MRAGELRHHLLIERADGWNKDAAGARTPTFAAYARPWGKVTFEQAAEGEQSGQVVARQTITVELRYSSAVAAVTPSEEFRLKYGTRYYDIRSVDDTRRADGRLILTCQARAEAA